MMDDDEREDRGTGRVRALTGPETSPQSAANAIDLAKINATLEAQASSATTWRWAGGLAAGLAISLGLSALNLAQQAAVDHERVGRLETFERERDASLARILEAQARQSTQLEQLQQTITEIRTDVRDLRADERRRENGERR